MTKFFFKVCFRKANFFIQWISGS